MMQNKWNSKLAEVIDRILLPLHLEYFIFFFWCCEPRIYTFFSNDYQPLEKLSVWDNYSYVHNLYQIKPCAMPLFNQPPRSRTVTYLKRKRCIAINMEIKVSVADIKPINNPSTGRQLCSPLPSAPVCCFDISPSQVNDSLVDLEINKHKDQPVPAILSTARSAISSLKTESGWYLCHSSRDNRSNSINYNTDVHTRNFLMNAQLSEEV